MYNNIKCYNREPSRSEFKRLCCVWGLWNCSECHSVRCHNIPKSVMMVNTDCKGRGVDLRNGLSVYGVPMYIGLPETEYF